MRYLREYGLADLSLRQLAERLGTSHRLLIYHFQSKEGLLTAITEEIEREQHVWARAISEQGLSPMEQLHSMWDRTADPALDQPLRLFVEMYGHTVQGRSHTAELLGTLVDTWLGTLAQLCRRMGMTTAEARIHARLILATVRGLMLDLLVTGDEKGTRAAWQFFIAQYDDLPGAHESRRQKR